MSNHPPALLTILKEEDRWDAHRSVRRYMLFVLLSYFAFTFAMRTYFDGLNNLEGICQGLSVVFVMLLQFEKFRDMKGFSLILVSLWLLYLLLTTINVVVMTYSHEPLWESGSTNTPSKIKDYMFISPSRMLLAMCTVIVGPTICGMDTKVIIVAGIVAIISCAVSVVHVTVFLGYTDKGFIYTIPGIAVMMGGLLLSMMITNERIRLNAVAHVKESQLQAQEWVRREEALHREKDQAISYIFHEVRNPVNAISMAAEIAMATVSCHEHPDQGTLLEMMRNVIQASDLATVVLNDVLSMERLQSGTFSFAVVPFQLAEAHRQVVRVLQYQMEHKQIQLACEIDPSLENLTVLGDANRLKQVVQNFLSNAYKFTPHGGQVTVQVLRLDSRILSDSDGGVVRIRTSVIDTGSGISDSERHKVFQPWGQLRAGEQKGGSGLGLALSKDFIEKGFGGTIDFTSTRNGSTFFFEVELRIVPESVEMTPMTPQGPMPSENVLPSHIQPPELIFENEDAVLDEDSDLDVTDVDVVVVDDSLMNRKLLVRILTNLGVTSTSCENGQEAVDLLTGRTNRLVRCRLVLMDKEMPVMDGYAATQALRSSSVFRGHIVGVTGNALDTQISEFLSYGAEEVITKPVKTERIELVLRQYGILRPDPSPRVSDDLL